MAGNWLLHGTRARRSGKDEPCQHRAVSQEPGEGPLGADGVKLVPKTPRHSSMAETQEGHRETGSSELPASQNMKM